MKKKNILVITQKIDKNDSVLGFFHRWVLELSKHFEKITVICLSKGEYDLPNNVKVLSLGKEGGESKIKYIKNFYKYIWQERGNYDTIFVHMNQEYILLGGLFWKMMGKRITMWRNHPAGSFLTDISISFCDKVFCTSKYSYTYKDKFKNKTKLMPVGIDTEVFKIAEGHERKPRSILFLSRISPIKRPDLFIDALKIMHDGGQEFTASIYGDPLPKDSEYYSLLKEKVKNFGLSDCVSFYSGISNTETISIYNAHEIFVNLSPSGMYDKTIFEAAACGTLPLTSNKNLADDLIKNVDHQLTLQKETAEYLANKLKALLNLSPSKLEDLRQEMLNYTLTKHSLSSLGNILETELK